MTKEISPAVAVVLVVIVLALAAFAWFKFESPARNEGHPPAMPELAAKQWQQFTGGKAPAGATPGYVPAAGTNTQSGGGAPPMPTPTGPPMGR